MKINIWIAVGIAVGTFVLGYFVDKWMNTSTSSITTTSTPAATK